MTHLPQSSSHLVDYFLSYRGFSVFKVLDCVVGLFHVERLLSEVVSLALIPGRYIDETHLEFDSNRCRE